MTEDSEITKPKKPSWLKQQYDWLPGYSAGVFSEDLVAAIIVTILLVPQSLAYALLAGLPPKAGIYASIFPLAVYAFMGSSRQLSVGPTAVVSLMTAAAIAAIPEGQRLVSAAALALMTGGFMLIFGLLKSGFIMNFVSRPVVSAYITGAGLLIIISQLRHIFGVEAGGQTALELLRSLFSSLSDRKAVAIFVGGGSILALWSVKKYLAYGLYKMGVKPTHARLGARVAPIFVVFSSIGLSAGLNLSERYGLRVVGDIPAGLPNFSIPALSLPAYEALIIPALIIAVVAFVDSMTIAQTLAARSRSRVDANKELLGLGLSNFFAGMTAGYPVNGSLSRSAVNFSAGAQTPIAGVLAAIFMAVTALLLTPYLSELPLATLAALIVVACFSMMEFDNIWRTWVYSRTDGLTALATFSSVLLLGVQWGVLVGVVLAMALHIRATLKPHMARVGRFPGTEHYRDADRFNVETDPEVVTLRIDESLYYANARYLEDKVARILIEHTEMTDLILMCPAVNKIDASALSSLHEINKRLMSANVKLHISELHSHVRERLHRSNFIEALSGQIFLSQHEAIEALRPEPDWSQFSDHIDIH